MATIKYKPTTPARRNMTVADYAEITKFSPEKSLVVIKKKKCRQKQLRQNHRSSQGRRQQAEVQNSRFQA